MPQRIWRDAGNKYKNTSVDYEKDPAGNRFVAVMQSRGNYALLFVKKQRVGGAWADLWIHPTPPTDKGDAVSIMREGRHLRVTWVSHEGDAATNIWEELLLDVCEVAAPTTSAPTSAPDGTGARLHGRGEPE
jgi:hypothetical protein